MNLLQKIKGNEKGQSIVEFALVLPLLLMLVLGAMEFGWLYNAKISVNAAAREGARVMSITGDLEQTEATVLEFLSSTNSINYIEVSAPLDEESEEVSVTVLGKVQPLIGLYVKGSQEISSNAIMRLEQREVQENEP